MSTSKKIIATVKAHTMQHVLLVSGICVSTLIYCGTHNSDSPSNTSEAAATAEVKTPSFAPAIPGDYVAHDVTLGSLHGTLKAPATAKVS